MVDEKDIQGEQQEQISPVNADGTPNASYYSDYDQYTAAVAAHAAREAVKEALTPQPQPESPEDKAWREATNPDGSYRSLGHMMDYMNEPLEKIPGAPNPYEYPAHFEEQFKSDLSAWKVGRSVAGALLQQPQPQLSPYFDDELKGRRDQILARAQHHHKQRILAEARGDREAVELHAYHGRSAEKELENLPKSKAQEQYEEALEQHEERIIDKLYNEREADQPHWQNERLQHDSAVELIRRNSIARVNKEGVGTVKLVALDAPWGNPLSVQPRNMCKPIELPRQVFEQFKREVRSDDPDKYFRQAHAFLERHGYGSQVEPAFNSSEGSEPKEGGAPNLAKMTNRAYQEHMNRLDAKKRTPPVMFPPRRTR